MNYSKITFSSVCARIHVLWTNRKQTESIGDFSKTSLNDLCVNVK